MRGEVAEPVELDETDVPVELRSADGSRVETHDTVEWLIAAEGLRTAMLTAQQVFDALLG